MLKRMLLISFAIGAIGFCCLFVYLIDPVILDPPISAEETEGLNDSELDSFFESRRKNIGYFKMLFFLAEYPGYKLKGVLLFFIVFILSFLSQLIFFKSAKNI